MLQMISYVCECKEVQARLAEGSEERRIVFANRETYRDVVPGR